MNQLTKHMETTDADAMLRDKMAEIEALVDAIAEGEPDCDLKLAELLEGEAELMRVAIVEKLREMIKQRDQEKEQELDKHLEAQRRVEINRQRNRFSQWLSWIMSEETLRKIREAFLAQPRLEAHVKNIGQNLAGRGIQAGLTDKRDLGSLHANVRQSQGQNRDRGGDKGRQ